MKRIIGSAKGISCLAACALALGCAATDQNKLDGAGGNAAGGSGPGASGTGANGQGGVLLGGFGGGSTEERGCSADLQYVIDEQGNVLETCAPDLGCSDGECIEPCQAAADSKGNVSCDFMVATPHFCTQILPPCFAAFLANNWPKEATITITRGGVSYDVTQFGRMPTADPNEATWPAVPASGLPEGQVAVLFLSHDPSSGNPPGVNPLTCPISPAVVAGNGSAVAGTGRGQAWHIHTSVPVSAYDILPYGGADSYLPSAELILPTTAWGDNYIAVLPKDSSGPPWGQILAATDGTTVDIVPTISLPAGGGVAAAPANQLTTFTLQAGEYIQWELAQDMTGAVIQSSHPISFTGGNAYICYSSQTSTGGGCDSAHQMIPPIKALGREFVAPPYPTRGSAPESIPYRLVGMVADTQLSFDPPVPGAPTIVGPGQAIDFETTQAFAVSSQDDDHPFYLGQIMPGCMVAGNPGNIGDEEFVNLFPPAQFLSKYVFFTDPTYPNTNLVFVRMAMTSGFKEVELACHGTLTGWTDVGTSGKFQMTSIALIQGGVPNGACTNGPQTAESEGPFGIMVWGLDWFSSYAYPAGGSVAPINEVVVPPVPE